MKLPESEESMYSKLELRQFLEQALSPDKASAIEAWLSESPERWRELDALADDPDLIAKLRGCLPTFLYQDEPELRRAISNAETASQAESPTINHPIREALEATPELTGYRIVRRIGGGGMGLVYEAEHELLHKRVAIKVMSGRLAGEAAAADRFLAEMKAIGQLNHPNLVQGMDARREDGKLFLVMEYLTGEDLHSFRKRSGPLPPEQVCNIIRQAALGLGHAHERGIIHRDVKPSNLWIGDDGVVKVLDLGLARFDSPQQDEQLTSGQVVVGTPDYISPEQVETPRDVDARADIYSLGCTMFYLLAGRSPFHQHSDTMAKIMAHVNEKPQLPQDVLASLPERLVQSLVEMMEKAPNQRMQTAEDVAEAMAPYCQKNVPVSIPHISSSSGKSDSAREHETKDGRPLWLWGAIPLALMLAFGVMLMINTEHGSVQLTFQDSSQLATVDVSKNGTITIKDPTDEQPIAIEIDRKQRKLRLSKPGFEVITKRFQLNLNGQRIDVVFKPLPQKVAQDGDSIAGQASLGDPALAPVQRKNGVAYSHRGGNWVVDGEEIVQTKIVASGCLLTFGDPSWSEYDLVVEGRIPKSERFDGFAVKFHHKSLENNLSFAVGVYRNKWHDVSRMIEGEWSRSPGMASVGSIVPDRWHKIRLKVRGTVVHCYLDDQLLFVSKEPLFESGGCALGIRDTRASFRNLRVVAPDGKVLWDGVPERIEVID